MHEQFSANRIVRTVRPQQPSYSAFVKLEHTLGTPVTTVLVVGTISHTDEELATHRPNFGIRKVPDELTQVIRRKLGVCIGKYNQGFLYSRHEIVQDGSLASPPFEIEAHDVFALERSYDFRRCIVTPIRG